LYDGGTSDTSGPLPGTDNPKIIPPRHDNVTAPAWAKGVFPAAHERLKQTAAALPPGTPAQPFADALTELVQAQADTTGFVVLHRWAEVLERHFPPQLRDPDRTTA
ncbi:hypothetical protein ACFQ71_37500, partial [Streptomyces sp. NPDC056534]|uniref:hypothetical protein n=1 Tax=Streptomyces sp. NPDC056534 TaxID=3345857 RepID=UPI0036CB4FFC